MFDKRAQLKRVVIADAVILAVVILLVLFGRFFLNLLPACGFYRFTGLYCAGCGGTRAVHAMLRLDFLTALRDNITAVLLAVILAVGFIRYNLTIFTGPIKDADTKIGAISICFMIFTVVYMIIRNIPGSVFEYLRPLP